MSDAGWGLDAYPLWHGMAQMRHVAAWSAPDRQLVSGSGCWVEDAGGRRFLDARAGICNVNLGYGRRDIAEAIYQQALTMPFACSIRYEKQTPVTHEYARELVRAAPSAARSRSTRCPCG